MNTTTPRVFIAATQQNAGKTTTSLGLYNQLRTRLGRIGFIKPVGQRFTEVEGKKIDEDSVLIQHTYNTQIPIEAMSPIAVEPNFTRRYIEHANVDALVRRIQHSFDRAAWEKEFVIIEGTGHAGVGSVFDLSNARVAKLLHAKVLLVTTAGIGKPIDEVALNHALFEREGVEVVGVVMNKLMPEKFDRISEIARKGFERLGLELLGVMPAEPILSDPTLEQICELVHGQFLLHPEGARRRVSNMLVGAMTPANLVRSLVPGMLLIVPGDREDVLIATATEVKNEETSLAGLVLSDGYLPHQRILEVLEDAGISAVASDMDSYTIASRIESMTVKTLPGDTEKIGCIQKMIRGGVDIDRLLQKLGVQEPEKSPASDGG